MDNMFFNSILKIHKGFILTDRSRIEEGERFFGIYKNKSYINSFTLPLFKKRWVFL